jgi:hypothetical protein
LLAHRRRGLSEEQQHVLSGRVVPLDGLVDDQSRPVDASSVVLVASRATAKRMGSRRELVENPEGGIPDNFVDTATGEEFSVWSIRRMRREGRHQHRHLEIDDDARVDYERVMSRLRGTTRHSG